MNRTYALPVLSAAGGAAAFVLRLVQNRTGFEPDTALPVPGAPAGIALAAALAALAAALAALARQIPAGQEPGFPEGFATDRAGFLTLPVLGAALVALSGAADLVQGLGLFPAEGFSPRLHLLLGALSLASAGGLMASAAACRTGRDRPAPGAALLIPPAALVVRLVLTYREDSVNPTLESYYVELLALAFWALAAYRLSSFAYGAGRTRRFALYAGCAAALCLTALADAPRSPAAPPLYAGGALSLLGFLLLRLSAPALPAGDPTDAP